MPSVVVAPLTVPDGYGHAGEFRYARTLTNKPLISPIQSPVTQAFRIDPGAIYKNKSEVAWALVPYINQELKDVVAAGCKHIQFDEPAYWIVPGGPEEMVEIFNACVEGVEATIGFHLCFGNFRGRPATSHRSFAAFAPYFKDLNVDVHPHRVRQPQHVRGRAVGEVRRRQDPVRGRDRRQRPQPGAGRGRRRPHPHLPALLRGRQALGRA